MSKQRVHIGAEVSSELENKARVMAAKNSISRSELFRQALAYYIHKIEKGELDALRPVRKDEYQWPD